MSGAFEWQTDEEESWNEPAFCVERSRCSYRPLLIILLLVGLAVGFTGLLFYRLVDRRVVDARRSSS